MAYLSLKSDYVFKKLFGEEPDILMDLLNAILDLPKDESIKELTVLNPEIPKELISDKTSIFDIRAINQSGEQIIIEMQAFPQYFFVQRALFYWAKTYASQLERGDDYQQLKKVYSINFIDFNLIDTKEYHSVFDIISRDNLDIQLTEDFEMHFLEIKKFPNTTAFADKLDIWMYIIANTEKIGDDIMKTIVDKQPVMKQVFDRLDKMSMNKTLLTEYEIRKRAVMDEKASAQYSYNKGIEDGIEKVAIKLLDILDDSAIAEKTGLSLESVKKLRNNQ